jgi:hypothetical protein
MQKFHPLTEKIDEILAGDGDRKIADSIIREYLGEKAKLYEDNGSLREILGLSTESEPENETAGWCEEHQKHCAHKPKTAEEWCEHTRHEAHWEKDWLVVGGHGLNGKDFMFCPICGTPRPTEKTLAEKFREYLPYAGSDMNLEGLAAIAAEHYGGKKS